jgi:hypothetical protein
MPGRSRRQRRERPEDLLAAGQQQDDVPRRPAPHGRQDWSAWTSSSSRSLVRLVWMTVGL